MQMNEQELDKSQNENYNSNIYFKTYSHLLLIISIKSLLNRTGGDFMEDTYQIIAIKMLKIVSSLSEKQEIGQFIIEEILLDLLFYVYEECESLNLTTDTASVKEKNEIIKSTCNFIFQSFQLNFIWDFCSTKFEQICFDSTDSNSENKVTTPSELCDLFSFILDLTNLVSVF
jgi:hypothetical protein